MDGPSSFWEILPLILALAPAIGFAGTSIAARFDPGLVQALGISNVLCALPILVGVVCQFEMEARADAAARVLTDVESTDNHERAAAQASLERQVDKNRAERRSRFWFGVDGTNLWSVIVLVVVASIYVWRSPLLGTRPEWFVPSVLAFESASLCALMAYDLRTYLISLEAAVIAMSVLIGIWGGPERRNIASRFFGVQNCGLAIVMFGFSMLVIAVPWMKIEDSTDPLAYHFHVSKIVYETQKWMSGNQVAFHYATEIFPMMLFFSSLGFAILFGLFPFHRPLVTLLGSTSPTCVVLYLVGTLAPCWVGWLRFVVPIAPDLMSGFHWLIVIPALGSAAWGVLRSFAPGSVQQSAASLFLSASGMSLLGFFCFSRPGFSGAWLMQHQVVLATCWAFVAFEGTRATWQTTHFPDVAQTTIPCTRTLLAVLGLSLIGFVASGFTISWELLRDDPLLVLAFFAIAILILLRLLTLLIQFSTSHEARRIEPTTTPTTDSARNSRSIVLLMLLAIASLFPSLMFDQCNQEFARTFRRFDGNSSAASAQLSSGLRQTSP